MEIEPAPGCDSVIYDNTGIVQWGDENTPSMTFYDAEKSNADDCDFEGPVEYSHWFFVCGFTDVAYAKDHCMNAEGTGGSPNFNYDAVAEGTDVNIKFPLCWQSTSSAMTATH
mmetsp:Transcript_16551/g.34939  ORF Transcript_16551/g.34939 Transcript_16551/m.34939 type:complete len:113 (-) Transcript_16551:134-472(-)